jgi:hypothetical protein
MHFKSMLSSFCDLLRVSSEAADLVVVTEKAITESHRLDESKGELT